MALISTTGQTCFCFLLRKRSCVLKYQRFIEEDKKAAFLEWNEWQGWISIAWIAGEVKGNCDLKEGSRQEGKPLPEDAQSSDTCHMKKEGKGWWGGDGRVTEGELLLGPL